MPVIFDGNDHGSTLSSEGLKFERGLVRVRPCGTEGLNISALELLRPEARFRCLTERLPQILYYPVSRTTLSTGPMKRGEVLTSPHPVAILLVSPKEVSYDTVRCYRGPTTQRLRSNP